MKNEVREFQKFIQKQNLLWSTEREIITEQVFDNHFHFTADDLFIQLNEKGKSVSRATVYRTLELLEESGMVSKIQMQNGKHLYEHIFGHQHHDHLICQKCGKMIEFHSEGIEELQRKVSLENNFKMTGHCLKIYGICSDCQNKEQTQKQPVQTRKSKGG
ncbi:MAG: transcriptional repressor [Candidatus Cloacimonadota bacterium]|nr:transcriptional repressor [Candidatus Cloacimonadota bacterium]